MADQKTDRKIGDAIKAALTEAINAPVPEVAAPEPIVEKAPEPAKEPVETTKPRSLSESLGDVDETPAAKTEDKREGRGPRDGNRNGGRNEGRGQRGRRGMHR